METFIIILQIIISLGIYNVWFIRSHRATVYRGKNAQNLKAEFRAYGLPTWFMYLIGTIKVLAATALLAGIWIPELIIPSATVLAVAMLGAVLMHIKVKDSFQQTAPALLMLVMNIAIIFLTRM